MPPKTISGKRIREAAEDLGCSIGLLLDLEREGEIPAARRTGGGHRVFNEHELEVAADAIRRRLSKRAAARAS